MSYLSPAASVAVIVSVVVKSGAVRTPGLAQAGARKEGSALGVLTVKFWTVTPLDLMVTYERCGLGRFAAREMASDRYFATAVAVLLEARHRVGKISP